MKPNAHDTQFFYRVYPVGTVRRGANETRLEILEPFRPALLGLEGFSHVIVLWWAHNHDDDQSRARLQTYPPYTQDHLMGVFATRAPYRPNPIALTTCKLLGVDKESGIVQVASIDALDGTPILDLKAYFPVSDRVRVACIPAWLTGWPEWMPEEGLGLDYRTFLVPGIL